MELSGELVRLHAWRRVDKETADGLDCRQDLTSVCHEREDSSRLEACPKYTRSMAADERCAWGHGLERGWAGTRNPVSLMLEPAFPPKHWCTAVPGAEQGVWTRASLGLCGHSQDLDQPVCPLAA